MSKNIIVTSVVLILLSGCDLLLNTENQGNNWFPLSDGQQWTYRVTESYIDVDDLDFLPSRFTVSVVGKTRIEGTFYLLVKNYFVPGITLPDTILVRNTGYKVYMRLQPTDEERLFYSFTLPDTLWNIPMYLRSGNTITKYGHLEQSTGKNRTIVWGSFVTFMRGESGWRETFVPGQGRTEIQYWNQITPVVWSLE